jgi:hypothetical protein
MGQSSLFKLFINFFAVSTNFLFCVSPELKTSAVRSDLEGNLFVISNNYYLYQDIDVKLNRSSDKHTVYRMFAS